MIDYQFRYGGPFVTSENRTFGESENRRIGESENRSFGESEFRRIGVSENRTFGESDFRRMGLSEILNTDEMRFFLSFMLGCDQGLRMDLENLYTSFLGRNLTHLQVYGLKTSPIEAVCDQSGSDPPEKC